MIVYVLQLHKGKYYVGKTDDVLRRWNEHVDGRFGAAWTKLYPPEDIIETVNDTGFTELAYTLKYMKEYGIDNVRGAEYCSNQLSKQQLQTIYSHIYSEDGRCFNCGGEHYVKNCHYVQSWWRRLFSCWNKEKNNDDYMLLEESENDDKIVNFGKYRGLTYKEVYRRNRGYCRWILAQTSNYKEFVSFQDWLRKKEV